MLRKDPPKTTRRLLNLGKAVIIGEAVFCALSYFGWRKLNHDRDARLFVYHNCNWALDAFYSTGELLDPNYKLRDRDFEYWTKEKLI